MAVQIFRLRGVPEDEASEVRSLLDEHDIDYYETPAGMWGMSMPAIWLRDESAEDRARELLRQYQADRLARVRAEGSQRTILDELREHPVRFLAIMVAIGVILYLSTQPFWGFGG